MSSLRTAGSSNGSHAVWDPGPQSCGTPAITQRERECPTMLSTVVIRLIRFSKNTMKENDSIQAGGVKVTDLHPKYYLVIKEII